MVVDQLIFVDHIMSVHDHQCIISNILLSSTFSALRYCVGTSFYLFLQSLRSAFRYVRLILKLSNASCSNAIVQRDWYALVESLVSYFALSPWADVSRLYLQLFMSTAFLYCIPLSHIHHRCCPSSHHRPCPTRNLDQGFEWYKVLRYVCFNIFTTNSSSSRCD